MAANNDRPLLVLHDEEEGHLVYDVFLVLDDNGEQEALACFPRPVAQFSAPLGCRAFAVSGGTVLGVFYDFWNHTVVQDTLVEVGGYLRCPKVRYFTESREMGSGYMDAPAMIPMVDGTVIRMDRVLFDGRYSFEALRLLPAGQCHAVPLPKPPITYLDNGEELVWVSAYFAMGTRVWISMARKGTYSFDTDTGTWRMEGMWELPFEGRALYVQELASVVGFAAETRHLCAYDFVIGTPPVMRHVWRETYPEDQCIYTAAAAAAAGQQQQQPSEPRDMPSLAYLGNGGFCICRPMSVMKPASYGPPMKYNAASFLVVVLRLSSSGELHLVRRGKTSYMHCPKGQTPYLGFVQPAICS